MCILLSLDESTDSLAAVLGDRLAKDALLAYLRGCPVVLSARTRTPDRFDQEAKPIPLAWYSDGSYVWTAAQVAYISRYCMAPPAEFVDHVVAAAGNPVSDLDDETRDRVLHAIRQPPSTTATTTPDNAASHPSPDTVEFGMVQWTVGFEEHMRGFFCAVTRYYEDESDEEFMKLERQQASAQELVAGKPDARRLLMLAGFKAVLAGDAWRQLHWGDNESFPWEEEPEFLREVLSIITKELEASLPANALPEGLTVEVVLGGGVLNAPLDQSVRRPRTTSAGCCAPASPTKSIS
jgi:hypothetical protein